VPAAQLAVKLPYGVQYNNYHAESLSHVRPYAREGNSSRFYLFPSSQSGVHRILSKAQIKSSQAKAKPSRFKQVKTSLKPNPNQLKSVQVT